MSLKSSFFYQSRERILVLDDILVVIVALGRDDFGLGVLQKKKKKSINFLIFLLKGNYYMACHIFFSTVLFPALAIFIYFTISCPCACHLEIFVN